MNDRRKPYWCFVCKRMHRRGSMIGHAHEVFENIAVKILWPRS